MFLSGILPQWKRLILRLFKVEQRAAICFFIHQGKLLRQTLDELQNAYAANEILPEKAVYQWHKAWYTRSIKMTVQKMYQGMQPCHYSECSNIHNPFSDHYPRESIF